ncbi:MAG: ImmA/IrrE family metallo-endopeptidase [Gemmatimonadales bacterium]|nr:ImmA/IrrE family metallo-endopeptidase [Gemmatimonadales bacterium]MDZ4388587.1 ImmA/IrrE family metallo-endopeptidase [Gemmatimonadales bacterium]
MEFAYLPDEAIDHEAERLRQDALGLRARDIPVDLDAIVYDHLCEHEGLIICDDVELADEDGETVLGKLEVGAGRIHISASLKTDRGRYRFTLAHELGHWRLHRPMILAGADQGSLFSSTGGNGQTMTTLNRGITGLKPPRHEIQANRFAAALLISPSALRREVSTRFGDTGIRELLQGMPPNASIRDRGRFIAAHEVNALAPLATAFDVSLEAMAIALESRGFLTTSSPTLF